MKSENKLIKSKLGLLNLAEHLSNVTKACKVMGYSRDSFYRIKQLYDTGGEAALFETSRSKPNHKNRVDQSIEDAVVKAATDQTAWGQQRLSNELRKQGIFVSGGGIRSIWLRHGLETFKKRLAGLEVIVAADGIILTEAQLIALEKKKDEQESIGEIETEHPGYLVAQDTYYVGNIKGVGRIYQQTVIDTYSRVAFAKLYDRKHAITAADALNDKVVPFFEEQQIPILRMLTDRGTEYSGKIEYGHDYQLYLTIENIDHSRIKARHPQSNGICERFHRTIQEEFYAIAFRKKLYTGLDDLQKDLDEWIRHYNEERPHSGRYCYGKTPMQTFAESLPLAKQKLLNNMSPAA
jgi:hypothetical protein